MYIVYRYTKKDISICHCVLNKMHIGARSYLKKFVSVIYGICKLFIEPRIMYIALELQITVAIKNRKKKWSRLYWNSTVFPAQKPYTASFLVPPCDQCMRKEGGKRPLRTEKMLTPASKQLFKDKSPQGSSFTLVLTFSSSPSLSHLCNCFQNCLRGGGRES